MTSIDLEFVRAQFPAFSDDEASQWVYMENAGGSLVPRQVTDKLLNFYTKTRVQPYGGYGPSIEAGEAMDLSQRLWAEAINADPDEISFGPSTSQNTYVLSRAFADSLDEGDEVIVTNQDHEANVGAWRRLARDGITVNEWQVDPDTGLLDPEDCYELLNGNTRLVCFTHCSNVAATLNPVREITDAVHDCGGQVVVDAVSYAPHDLADVRELDVDYYLFSLYKVYGPHLGVLYSKRENLEEVANQGHFFNAAKLDSKLAPAGPNHAEIGCASGVIEYFDAVYAHHFGDTGGTGIRERVEVVYELFGRQEQALMEPLMNCLTAKEGVHIAGLDQADHTRRAPTISFFSEKLRSAEIAKALYEARIGAGQGHFYGYRLVEALGLDPEDGVVRLSLVHYNSLEDVERAIEVLERVL